MLLLPNATLNTSRPGVSSGSTLAATSYATGISAHIMPTSTAYRNLPVAALESDYEITLESGTDIKEGDIITSILQSDGTAWPTVGLGTNTHETFVVVYTRESTPGHILQHRKAYVTRVRGGGPVY